NRRGWSERAAVEPDPLPEEPFRAGIPGEQDEDRESDRQPGWRRAGPRTLVRARQRRHLEDALRSHHDLGECERVVGEGAEQLRVEGARAVMPLPTLAGRDDLVDAPRREGRDQSVDVA